MLFNEVVLGRCIESRLDRVVEVKPTYIVILRDTMSLSAFKLIYNVCFFQNLTDREELLLITMSRVFANGPGNRGSIPRRVITKTQKMVLDVALLNTQHYMARIKGKVKQSREWRGTLSYISV